MSKEMQCPWCSETVTPEAKVAQRNLVEVVERNCPRCGKVIAAYRADEEFLDIIHQRVLIFKD